MRILTCFLALMLTIKLSSAETDTTKKDTLSYKIDVNASITSKNIWRGVDFGNGSPSILGSITFSYKDKYLIGSYFSTAVTGTTIGYANTLNFFIGYKYKNFTFLLDDYYFQGDITNIPTNYWHHDKTHFIESRIEYVKNKFSAKIGYTIYGGKLYNNPVIDSLGNMLQNTKGLYLEINIKLTENFSIFCGGITNASALNFHDRYGVTNVGLKAIKELKLLGSSIPMEATIVFNPNYKNVSPKDIPRVGYASSPVNFGMSFNF